MNIRVIPKLDALPMQSPAADRTPQSQSLAVAAGVICYRKHSFLGNTTDAKMLRCSNAVQRPGRQVAQAAQSAYKGTAWVDFTRSSTKLVLQFCTLACLSTHVHDEAAVVRHVSPQHAQQAVHFAGHRRRGRRPGGCAKSVGRACQVSASGLFCSFPARLDVHESTPPSPPK